MSSGTERVSESLGPSSTAGANKYGVVAELGRGGMATVYLAVVKGPGGFNKLHVLKRLRPALAADPEFLQMFLDEARLAARISHPNVVQTNEVGFDGKYHYIAMEYLDGQPLEMILRRAQDKGGMPLEMHLHVIAEALKGLHFAHELTDFDGTALRVVHRDVSPHNVMVTYDGFVKVLDFGIAKAADSSTDTRTGILKGKCGYMAPEQFGGHAVDRRADIFAVGVMMWQALTGKRLWQGLSDAEIFARIAKGDIPSPRSVKRDVPEAIDAVCMRALARDPADRYATAADLRVALTKCLEVTRNGESPPNAGVFAAELFADHRAAIKAAIESQLKSAKISGVRTRALEVPVLWSMTPGSAPKLARVEESEGADALVVHRSRRLAILVSVAILAAGIAVAGIAISKRPNRQTAATRDESIVAPSATVVANLTQLTVHGSPSEATLFVDDAPLQSNPATSTFVRDGASHRVRAEATGFVSKTELVLFDSKTLSMDISLDRKTDATPSTAPSQQPRASRSTSVRRGQAHVTAPAAPPEDTSTVAAASPPAATPAPSPAPTSPPERDIKTGPNLDRADPWTHASH